MDRLGSPEGTRGNQRIGQIWDVQKVVMNPAMSSFDMLGSFYHVFVSYGGEDGSTLGVVLAPEHVTTLMVDLIDVVAGGWVLEGVKGV